MIQSISPLSTSSFFFSQYADLPEAPDLEELWQKVGESYLPDAIREFAKPPAF